MAIETTTGDRAKTGLTILATVGSLTMIGAAGALWGAAGTFFATGLVMLLGAIEGEIIRAIKNS